MAGTPRRPDVPLRIVAAFKFGKAVLLVAAGLGALELLRPSFADAMREWARALTFGAGVRIVVRFFSAVGSWSPQRLRALGVVAFLYAGLYIIEGTGLWLAKRWAEYLTVIATLSFIPVELYELSRRMTPARIGALALNAVVAGYLIYRLRRDRNPEDG